MKKVIYLLMSLSLVAFASCNDDDKENPSSENGENGSSQSAVSIFKSGTHNGHDYVDLGLSSGTKWATANVGASKPEDYGNYYAWGETTTKEVYSWDTYKYGSYDLLTKYSNDSYTDIKTTLDLADDAAKANWGGKWRMPTDEQQNELLNDCYWVWTESYNYSNVAGYIVYKAKTSSDKGVEINKGETPSSSYTLSDAHIFLPAAGYRRDGDLYGAGASGYYWSSSVSTVNPGYAWYVGLYSVSVEYYYLNYRPFYGQSVRAVCSVE